MVDEVFDEYGKLRKKYGVIIADCPWMYSDMKNNDPALGGFKYSPMPIEKLIALPIQSVTKDNCALFMWATMPMLEEALCVIREWGFMYITCAFVWIKLNKGGIAYTVQSQTERDLLLENGVYSGLGHYVNGNAELCLLARKGSIARKNKNVKQIVFAPVGKHSSKPDEVQKRIINLLEDEDRLELFARRHMDGWDCTGLQLDNRCIEDILPGYHNEVGCI